jgi:hypothetical protein
VTVVPVTTATEPSIPARSLANNVAEPAVGASAVAADVSRWQSRRAEPAHPRTDVRGYRVNRPRFPRRTDTPNEQRTGIGFGNRRGRLVLPAGKVENRGGANTKERPR